MDYQGNLLSLPWQVRDYITKLERRVNQLELSNGSSGLNSFDSPAGQLMNVDWNDVIGIDAQIIVSGSPGLSGSSGVPYAWQEVEPIGNGQWQVKVDGMSGTTTINPAYERNGRFVNQSVYVKLWRGWLDPGTALTDLNWVFDGGLTTTIDVINADDCSTYTLVFVNGALADITNV